MDNFSVSDIFYDLSLLILDYNYLMVDYSDYLFLLSDWSYYIDLANYDDNELILFESVLF